MPLLSAGVGFKPAHFTEAMSERSDGLWLEVHPENYLADGGPRPRMLEALRSVHPVSLHGVSLSLAGPQPPDREHLARLASLVQRIAPSLVSEHLAWSRLGELYEPDLLPILRDGATLAHVCRHIDLAQTALGRSIAIENPAHYLDLDGHDWDEVDFLHELVRRTGCCLLVDVANVHLSAHNLGFDASAWLDRIDGASVAEIHLAGYSIDPVLGESLWIDSHDAAVPAATWSLFERLIDRIGPRPTLIERDGRVPAFEALLAERQRAQDLLSRTWAPT